MLSANQKKSNVMKGMLISLLLITAGAFIYMYHGESVRAAREAGYHSGYAAAAGECAAKVRTAARESWTEGYGEGRQQGEELAAARCREEKENLRRAVFAEAYQRGVEETLAECEVRRQEMEEKFRTDLKRIREGHRRQLADSLRSQEERMRRTYHRRMDEMRHRLAKAGRDRQPATCGCPYQGTESVLPARVKAPRLGPLGLSALLIMAGIVGVTVLAAAVQGWRQQRRRSRLRL